jgi:hypothetical protein
MGVCHSISPECGRDRREQGAAPPPGKAVGEPTIMPGVPPPDGRWVALRHHRMARHAVPAPLVVPGAQDGRQLCRVPFAAWQAPSGSSPQAGPHDLRPWVRRIQTPPAHGRLTTPSSAAYCARLPDPIVTMSTSIDPARVAAVRHGPTRWARSRRDRWRPDREACGQRRSTMTLTGRRYLVDPRPNGQHRR